MALKMSTTDTSTVTRGLNTTKLKSSMANPAPLLASVMALPNGVMNALLMEALSTLAKMATPGVPPCSPL